tara:strand:- start:262 stop:561 length:300 start_codon:yes stop_codon:yes gene_type:complete
MGNTIIKFDAVKSLVGGSLSLPYKGEITYHSGQTPPSDAEIDAEVIRLQAEYDALEYARKREAEYPSIAELTIALYDEADKSALVAKRNAVKLKYPKPS